MLSAISRRAGVATALGTALTAAAIAFSGGVANARAAVAASVSVQARTVTRPIPADFLGLALEFSTVPAWAGGSGPDPVLLNLIRGLTPAGRPSVRIGGLSTDRTWWPAPGVRRPAGVTYALSAGWARTVTALARALDARLILGVNFEADDRALAAAEVRAYRATIPGRYLSALDLGNEMPLYTSVPWYRISGGTLLPWYATSGQAVFSRRPSWGPGSFVRDYTRVLAALPPTPVAGPDTQNIAFFGAYDRLLSRRSRVRMLTSHGYGLNTCVTNPHVPTYPTVAHLLTRYALDDLLAGLSPSIALAHRNAASFRIDEMGSVTCGGRPGVSDTMASALWAAQALFTVARAGVDGVNLHTYPGLPNALYDLRGGPGARTASVHPLYYGALLFARAAPAGSRLAAISTRGPLTLRAWATAGPGRARHVLLVNASPDHGAAVALTLPRGAFASGAAQLQRLQAPNVRSRGPITLGGRSFGAVTATGTLTAPRSGRIVPRGRVYRVLVPAGSAALLTLSGPGARRHGTAGGQAKK